MSSRNIHIRQSAGTGSPPSVQSHSTKQEISQIPEVEESKEISNPNLSHGD